MNACKINQQSGIALFSVIVFLLLSTLIAVSSLQRTLFSEKMTHSNLLQSNTTNAAEYALHETQQFIDTHFSVIISTILSAPTSTICASGLCIPIKHTSNFSDKEHWQNSATWNNSNHHKSVDVSNISNKTSVKVIIEFLGYNIDLGEDGTQRSLCAPAADYLTNPVYHQYPYCQLDIPFFRITAHASTGNRYPINIMLQSTYLSGKGRKSWRKLENP